MAKRTAAQDKERRESAATMKRDDEQRDPHADTALLAPARSAKDVKAEQQHQVEGGTEMVGLDAIADDHERATQRDSSR